MNVLRCGWRRCVLNVGLTRFRITFTKAGAYPYICALHDDWGMVGKVIVLP